MLHDLVNLKHYNVEIRIQKLIFINHLKLRVNILSYYIIL